VVEWQTRRTQNSVGETLCGFKSRLRHHRIISAITRNCPRAMNGRPTETCVATLCIGISAERNMTHVRIRKLFERRFTIRLIFAFSGSLIIQFVAGCSAATPPVPTTPSLALSGQWRQTHLGIAGELKQCPASVTAPGGSAISCGAEDTVEFKPDGTFLASLSGLDAQISGKWRFEGSTLQITFIGPPEVAGKTTSVVVQLNPKLQSHNYQHTQWLHVHGHDLHSRMSLLPFHLIV
jgi:hypothetical protein